MHLRAGAAEINRRMPPLRAGADQRDSGQVKLSSWPSGSVMWKKRSPPLFPDEIDYPPLIQ